MYEVTDWGYFRYLLVKVAKVSVKDARRYTNVPTHKSSLSLLLKESEKHRIRVMHASPKRH